MPRPYLRPYHMNVFFCFIFFLFSFFFFLCPLFLLLVIFFFISFPIFLSNDSSFSPFTHLFLPFFLLSFISSKLFPCFCFSFFPFSWRHISTLIILVTMIYFWLLFPSILISILPISSALIPSPPFIVFYLLFSYPILSILFSYNLFLPLFIFPSLITSSHHLFSYNLFSPLLFSPLLTIYLYSYSF